MNSRTNKKNQLGRKIKVSKKRNQKLLKWINQKYESYFVPKSSLRVILQDCDLSDIVLIRFITLIKYAVEKVLTFVHLKLVRCDVLDKTKTN